MLSPMQSLAEQAWVVRSADVAPAWSAARKLWFRFAVAYWLLYYYPFPLGAVPITEDWGTVAGKPLDWLSLWVGKHWFGLTHVFQGETGSGDTTLLYLRLLCVALLAVLTAAVWTALDRRRPHYRAFAAGMRVYLRWVLGVSIIGYGVCKLIRPLQFPAPGPWRLAEQFGESSPMGLLWTFMGASPTYQHFAGAAETLGGLLLFSRRLTRLGALLLVPVLGNVVLLNFCYDVPVKQYSSHLLVTALVLLLPDAKRLFQMVVLSRAVPAAPLARPAGSARAAWLRRGCQGVGICLAVGATVYGQYKYQREAPWLHPAFAGYFAVEERGAAWTTFAIDAERDLAAVRRTDGRLERMHFKFDTAQHTLTLADREDDTELGKLVYGLPAPDALTLTGTWRGEPLALHLRRQPVPNVLMTRGFHWINEQAFNR
jgi:hypothetical protein